MNAPTWLWKKNKTGRLERPFSCGISAKGVCRTLDQLLEIESLCQKGELPSLDLGHVENVLDVSQQEKRRVADGV
jgi:hypothetical protein